MSFSSCWNWTFAAFLAIGSLAPTVGYSQTTLGITRLAAKNPGSATQCRVGDHPTTHMPTMNALSTSKAYGINMMAMQFTVTDTFAAGSPSSDADETYAANADEASSHATATRASGGGNADGMGELNGEGVAEILLAVGASPIYAPTQGSTLTFTVENVAKYADVTSTMTGTNSITETTYTVNGAQGNAVLTGELHVMGSMQWNGVGSLTTLGPNLTLSSTIGTISLNATRISTGWAVTGSLPTGAYTAIDGSTGLPVDLSPYVTTDGITDELNLNVYDDEIDMYITYDAPVISIDIDVSTNAAAWTELSTLNGSSGTTMTSTFLYNGLAEASFVVTE